MELETKKIQDRFGRPYVEFNNRKIGVKEADCLIIWRLKNSSSDKNLFNSFLNLGIESIKTKGFNLIDLLIYRDHYKELQFINNLSFLFDLNANTIELTGTINFLNWDKQISIKEWFISLQNKISFYHGDIKSEFRYDNFDDYFHLRFEELNSLKESYNYILSLLTKSSLEIFEENQSTIITKIEIPKALRTAFHQYLIFFGTFTEKAKSKRIEIQIKEYDEGLELSFDKTIDTESVQEYLNEYINFVKNKVENIDPKIETELNSIEHKLLIAELKNEVRNLESKLEIKDVEIKYLNTVFKSMENIALTQAQNPAPLQISSAAHSNAVATSNSSIDFKVEIQGLQNDFLEFKGEMDKHLNEAQKKELEKIDTELLEVDETVKAPEKVDKKSFKRLKRVIDQINKPNSDWNKAIKASKKGVEYLKSIGKAYNKIAQHVDLPNITEVLGNIIS